MITVDLVFTKELTKHSLIFTCVLCTMMSPCLQGVLIHADVAVGLNTLAQIQQSHEHSVHPTYTPDGRQK